VTLVLLVRGVELTIVLLLGEGRRMQPSIAAENTRQRIIMKYIPQVFVKQDNKKCRSVVNEQKFRKLGSC